MTRVLGFGIAALGAISIAGFAGCNGSGVVLPFPSSSPSPQVVYVSAFGTSNLAIIPLPVTNVSVPTYISPTGLIASVQLTFDGSKNLWSMDDTTSSPAAVGYNRPLSGASSPFASVNIPTPAFPTAIAFDSSGNLWVTDGGQNKVFEFAGPTFSGTTSPTPAITLSTGVSGPDGLAFDTAGNLYVSNNGTNTVLIFDAPLTNGESPTLAPITGLHGPAGITFDASGNLYVANFSNGSIARKNAPTAGGGAVETTDTATTITSAEGLAFDASGNLYATDLQHSTLNVFPLATSAFSATLAPSVTLTLTGFGASSSGGVAVGPP